MTLLRVLAVGALGLAMAACSRDTEGTLLPQESIGAVRYFHAVPDSRALDFRVVDIPSNASLFGAAYRGTLPFPAPVRSGNRAFRAFISSANIDSAQIRLMDTQHNIAEGTRYTIILTGTSVGGDPDVVITEDNAPDPGNAFTIRVTHVGVGEGAIDAFVVGGTAGDVQVANGVAYQGNSGWSNVPTESGLTLQIREAGTANVIASGAIPAGSPPTATGLTAIPGSTQAGSGLTAFVTTGAVIGSPACPLDDENNPTCNAAAQAPAVTFVYDRRP